MLPFTSCKLILRGQKHQKYGVFLKIMTLQLARQKTRKKRCILQDVIHRSTYCTGNLYAIFTWIKPILVHYKILVVTILTKLHLHSISGSLRPHRWSYEVSHNSIFQKIEFRNICVKRDFKRSLSHICSWSKKSILLVTV